MMTADEIWNTIVTLSKDNGSYKRLRIALEISPDKDEFLESWSKNDFHDINDFIFWHGLFDAYEQLLRSLPDLALIECDNGIIGNGFIHNEYLFTAAHVVKGSERISVITPTRNVDILTSSALIICDDNPSLDNMAWNDFAVFKAEIPLRSFGLQTRNPNKRRSLICKNIRMTARGMEIQNVGCKVVEKKGNFIGCQVDIPLKEGMSGAPLLDKGSPCAILIGGDNGNPCLFQSIESILRKMNEDGVPHDIGWYDY